MMRGLRRFVLPLAVLALVAAQPVGAAEPPTGVVLDATVTVTVVADPADGGTAEAIEGATVVLRAATNDFPDDPIQELTAATDASGIATFDGVARADAGGPEVFLSAEASIESTTSDGECIVTESWFGIAGDVPSSDGLDIPITALPASSIVCPPPDDALPAGLVRDGSIELDVTLDGSPVDAQVSAIVRSGVWVEIVEGFALDGHLALDGIARPDDGGPAVEVLLQASASVASSIAGCAFTVDATGETTLDVSDATPLSATIELTAADFEAPGLSQAVAVVARLGGPVAGGSVFVSQSRPDGGDPWTCHAVSGPDGTVTIPIYDWGTPEGASVVDLESHGPVSVTEVRGECTLSFGPYGLTSFVQDGSAVEDVTIVTDVIELDAVCSTTGTPDPPVQAPGAGGPTLPPTDVAFSVDPATTPLLPAILAVLGALAIVVAFTLPVRRRR